MVGAGQQVLERAPGRPRTLVATAPEVSDADRRRLERYARHLPPRGGADGLPTGMGILGRGGLSAVVLVVISLAWMVVLAVGVAGPWWLAIFVGMVLGGGLAEIGDRVTRRRTLRRCQGRFLLDADVGERAVELLRRADTAVDDVLGLQAVTDGVLDDADIAVTLRQQRWDIAQDLAKQHRLRQRLESAAGEGGERTADVVAEQLDAVDAAARESAAEVRRLERYARQVRAADESYRDWRLAQDLRVDHDDECADLVAGTVRSSARAADLRRLTERATAVTTSLDTDRGPAKTTR